MPPSEGLTHSKTLKKKLLNFTRAEEIEEAAMEVDGDEDGAGIKLSVSDYKSERLG